MRVGLQSDQIEAYERLHSAIWPEVLATISACNIRNYSIFCHETLLSRHGCVIALSWVENGK